MSIRLEGLDEVLAGLDNLNNSKNLKSAMEEACSVIETAAKKNCPKGTGALRRSIKSKVEAYGNDITGIVYTPLFYASFIEYGTGKFAEENPRSGYWVYVQDSSGDGKKTYSGKRYSLEEAKRVVAIMRANGLDAVYTQGRQPTPFMRPALYQNSELIKQTIKGAFTND
jgi:HK97 gp10 family phage protein